MAKKKTPADGFQLTLDAKTSAKLVSFLQEQGLVEATFEARESGSPAGFEARESGIAAGFEARESGANIAGFEARELGEAGLTITVKGNAKPDLRNNPGKQKKPGKRK